MLILMRSTGQEILIDNNIYMRIINVNEHIVKIGFMAPKKCKIYRTEIFNQHDFADILDTIKDAN